MKPKHHKAQRKKEVRRLQKRRQELWKEIRDLGYRKLPEPIRHGWYKELVITENVERYKNQKEILEVFDTVEKYYWGRTKTEADTLWFKQVSKFLIYKDLPTISKKQFNRLTDKAQKLCTAFQYRNDQKKLKVRFYIRIPKNAYRIRYSKAYITHSKIIDPELERESDLLEQKLLHPKYYNLSQYRWKWWKDMDIRKVEKQKMKKSLKVLKHYAIEDIIENNIQWERN